MFALTTLSLLVVTLILYIKWVFKKSCSYLDSLGIPYTEPKWLFGNVRDTVLKKKPQFIAYQEVYEKFPSHKVVGFFYFNTPVLVLHDLDMIKTVLIKDFASFPRNDGKAFHKNETLSYNLFTMRAQHPRIQEKARAEVLSVLENNNGELTYELLSKMTYLNMVICAARFVKMELMVAVISVLKNFSIEVAPKTKVPVELYTGVVSPLIWVRGGIRLKFRSLNGDQ